MSDWNLAETSLGVSGDAEYQVAVLPVGATEAHGLHLPYATDTIQVEEIAKAACAKASGRGAEVLLLPTIQYGVNENNLEFPWTMSVRPSTLFSFITDIVMSVEHHGIPKMILLNGHGGNEFQPLLRELCRQTGVQIMLVNWYSAAASAGRKLFEKPGEHADEMETSMLLNLRPELVHMELAGDGAVREPVFTAMKEGWGWVARPWERFTHDSSYGDPSKAAAEKGKAYFATVVEKLAGLLVEMSKAPVDDWYPYKETVG
jgi:creatinine amidohydrolase